MPTMLGRFRAILGVTRRRSAGDALPTAGDDDGSVRDPDKRDQDWLDLAAELTPVKSLGRIDLAATRVMSTVTILGALITGFGIYTSGYPTAPRGARWFALGATIAATLAVICALAGQLVSVTTGL